MLVCFSLTNIVNNFLFYQQELGTRKCKYLTWMNIGSILTLSLFKLCFVYFLAGLQNTRFTSFVTYENTRFHKLILQPSSTISNEEKRKRLLYETCQCYQALDKMGHTCVPSLLTTVAFLMLCFDTLWFKYASYQVALMFLTR